MKQLFFTTEASLANYEEVMLAFPIDEKSRQK